MHPKLIPLVFFILIVGCAPKPGQWRRAVEVHSTATKYRVGKIGILPFRSNKTSAGDQVADFLAARLLESNLVVIERTYLTTILQEQALSLTGLSETDDYRKIGHLADVEFLVAGTLGLFEGVAYTFILNATARIIDVETGQVVAIFFYKVPRGPGSEHWAKPEAVGMLLAEAIKHEFQKKQH
jgi:hypothetical protein